MLKEEHKAFYDEIFPALDIYEDKRKEANRSTFILTSILLLIYSVVLFFVIPIMTKSIGPWLHILIFLGSIFLFISQLFRRKYISRFKRDVIINLFDKKGVKIMFHSKKRIDEKYFEDSALFTVKHKTYTLDDFYKSYSGRNLILGEKDGVSFKSSQLHAFKGSSDTKKTIFKGVFLIAELPISHNNDLTIYSKNFPFLNKKIPDNTFKTSNKDFESYFNIDCSSHEKASLLLKPVFMERLIAFRTKHKLPFVLKIIGSSIYLAIHEDKDFFKVSIKEKAYHQKNLKILSEDADFFFDIIDLLGVID